MYVSSHRGLCQVFSQEEGLSYFMINFQGSSIIFLIAYILCQTHFSDSHILFFLSHLINEVIELTCLKMFIEYILCRGMEFAENKDIHIFKEGIQVTQATFVLRGGNRCIQGDSIFPNETLDNVHIKSSFLYVYLRICYRGGKREPCLLSDNRYKQLQFYQETFRNTGSHKQQTP